MNRANLQRLAEERVLDAEILLGGGQWSGAYYLAGYAVECGLKSCVLALIERTGEFFIDKKLQGNCWTHDIEKLVKFAGLISDRDLDIATNPERDVPWQLVKRWDETSRYEEKRETEARELYEAFVDPTHGVLPWIKVHW